MDEHRSPEEPCTIGDPPGASPSGSNAASAVKPAAPHLDERFERAFALLTRQAPAATRAIRFGLELFDDDLAEAKGELLETLARWLGEEPAALRSFYAVPLGEPVRLSDRKPPPLPPGAAIVWLCRRARQGRLTVQRLAVLGALLPHIERLTGECWVGDGRLVERTGLSKSTVRRVLEDLEIAGLLTSRGEPVGRRTKRYLRLVGYDALNGCSDLNTEPLSTPHQPRTPPAATTEPAAPLPALLPAAPEEVGDRKVRPSYQSLRGVGSIVGLGAVFCKPLPPPPPARSPSPEETKSTEGGKAGRRPAETADDLLDDARHWGLKFRRPSALAAIAQRQAEGWTLRRLQFALEGSTYQEWRKVRTVEAVLSSSETAQAALDEHPVAPVIVDFYKSMREQKAASQSDDSSSQKGAGGAEGQQATDPLAAAEAAKAAAAARAALVAEALARAKKPMPTERPKMWGPPPPEPARAVEQPFVLDPERRAKALAWADAVQREAREQQEAAERLERERLEETERLERERRDEAERLARQEAERQEAERLERERLEAERLAALAAAEDQERLRREGLRREVERLKRRRLRRERLAAERLERLVLAAVLGSERCRSERDELKRQRAERRLTKAAHRADEQRLELAELAEERLELERLAELGAYLGGHREVSQAPTVVAVVDLPPARVPAPRPLRLSERLAARRRPRSLQTRRRPTWSRFVASDFPIAFVAQPELASRWTVLAAARGPPQPET